MVLTHLPLNQLASPLPLSRYSYTDTEQYTKGQGRITVKIWNKIRDKNNCGSHLLRPVISAVILTTEHFVFDLHPVVGNRAT
jgi:hypothetical protein